MTTKRLASHYFLRADGTLGQFPVVTVAGDGSILSVEEHGRAFTETAGVSFFGGIMLPGFIAFAADGAFFSPARIRQLRLEGFLRFVCNSHIGAMDESRLACVADVGLADGCTTLPAFTGQADFASKVKQMTLQRAHDLSVYPQWGVLQAGTSPGIMVVEGIDLRSFSVVKAPLFRILIP